MAEKLKLEDSPFIRDYTLAILKAIMEMRNWKKETKQVINADLIPPLPRLIAQVHAFPQERKIIHYPKQKERKTIQIQPTEIPETISNKEFGKIDMLIKDPSITTIECVGPGKEINIIRAGIKQATKITINLEEINNILKKIAEIARVPLIEGIFRAAVRDFIIDAVVSKTIGSRFVIKKYNPYALLESNNKNNNAPTQRITIIPPNSKQAIKSPIIKK